MRGQTDKVSLRSDVQIQINYRVTLLPYDNNTLLKKLLDKLKKINGIDKVTRQ